MPDGTPRLRRDPTRRCADSSPRDRAVARPQTTTATRSVDETSNQESRRFWHEPTLAPLPLENRSSAVQDLLDVEWELHMMSLVRLLGFTTLGCGCVTGHYREVATNREITYVEEKGVNCHHHAHRRNHTLSTTAFGLSGAAARAS